MKKLAIHITPLLLLVGGTIQAQSLSNQSHNKAPVAASLAGPLHYQAANTRPTPLPRAVFAAHTQTDTLKRFQRMDYAKKLTSQASNNRKDRAITKNSNE